MSGKLKQYLIDKDILFMICATVFANLIIFTSDMLIKYMIYPISNKLLFNNTLQEYLDHKKNDNDKIINIFDIKFNISKLLYTVGKIFVVFMLLKILFRIFKS